MTIKIKISELLGKHKMSQKELAEKTGIRPATISALFHEQIKRIDVNHIDSLCEIFNCTPGELFEHIPNKGRSDNNIDNDDDFIYSDQPLQFTNKINTNDMELVNTEQGIVITGKSEDKDDMELVNTEQGIVIKRKSEDKDDMELVNTEQGIMIREKREGDGKVYKLTRKYIEEILLDIIKDSNKKDK